MAMMHMKAPASMCKSCKGAGCPTCMDDGGQVQPQPNNQPLLSKEDADKFKQGLDHGPDAWGNLKKAVGYADGGEVEGEEGMDDEIHSALGSELLDAFERKDSKAIMSGIEAVVLSILSKE